MKKLLLCLLLLLCFCLAACQMTPRLSPEEQAQVDTFAMESLSRIQSQVKTQLFISQTLHAMSREEKVAQLFIASFPASDQAAFTQQYQPGGYIFFATDFRDATPESFTTLVDSCLSQAKIGMFLSVDEEGGTVNRVSSYSQFRSEKFSSPQVLYHAGGLERIAADTVEKTELLKSLRLNLNFAPVADISTNSSDFIYSRSFGQDAAATAEYVSLVAQTMQQNKLGSVLKHFPGYGNNIDTHAGIAIDNRSLESLRNNDFLPFAAGIKQGASMVLVSHNIVTCLDADMPASLSPAWHQLLREELGFNGVIITDDLTMGAITAYSGDTSPAVLAILAGNDMICSRYFLSHYQDVLAAVESGIISETMLNRAIYRILWLKLQLGIISPD